ncbi:MAG: hypothetical protein HWE23_01780 [Rhodobacteraceae bacterium]|nr:hypothetical protein [Paracoccaceae bacterium]
MTICRDTVGTSGPSEGPKEGPRGLSTFLADRRAAAQLHLAEGYVARAFCIKPNDLYQQTRGRSHIAEARQLVMYLAHVELGMSISFVAQHFGRDRSTVAYACREVEQRREAPEFNELVTEIEELVSQMSEEGVSYSDIFGGLQ